MMGDHDSGGAGGTDQLLGMQGEGPTAMEIVSHEFHGFGRGIDWRNGGWDL